jgi:hypothetical protein
VREGYHKPGGFINSNKKIYQPGIADKYGKFQI